MAGQKTCKNCGGKGHNKRTCKVESNADVASADVEAVTEELSETDQVTLVEESEPAESKELSGSAPVAPVIPISASVDLSDDRRGPTANRPHIFECKPCNKFGVIIRVSVNGHEELRCEHCLNKFPAPTEILEWGVIKETT